ncbi:MAG: protein kinase, partial [Acidobacteria bacterium]|nr:protein kinase [Acidobacteriota bacterium]
MALKTGDRLGPYEILSPIGAGGMGEVYRAHDTKLNRTVAVKILPKDMTGNQERRLRFEREAQAAAALNHPNIAVIHEVNEHCGNPYLVMEYIEGKTLREIVGDRPLPLKDWFRLSIPIADGLAHAHKNGIAHRDLKLDNVMVTGENQVKILDFGLAKLLEPESLDHEQARDLHSRLNTISQELTRAGKVYGTAAYMSPEQARGEAVDHRTDIFSLGVLLYQMASGQAPFQRDSQIETLHSIIKEDPKPLHEINAEIPIEAERVVRKAMEKERERRYQHADEMATDLRNLQRDLDSGRVTVPASTVSIPSRRTPWLPIAASVVGIAAVAAAAAFFLGRGERPISATAPVPVTENSTVGVVGFETVGDPADTGNLNRMLMSLITTDLVESGGLDVISVSRVLSAQREILPDPGSPFDAAVATQVARRAGIGRMLVGQVGSRGSQLFLNAELVDVVRGTALASFTKTAESEAELFALADSIAEEVRRILGVSGEKVTQPGFDLAAALTSSPEAYRHYSEGLTRLHQQSFIDAIEHLERAVQADPTFALAYYRLAFAQGWYGLDQESVATLEKGLEHIDRLPVRWQIVYRASLDHRRGNEQAAYEALTELIESSPEIPEAYYDLGEISVHSSRHYDLGKVRELNERVLELDPTYKIVLFHLTDAYISAEDLESAQALVDRYQREDPDDPAVRGAEIALLNARGEYRKVIAIGLAMFKRKERQALGRIASAYMLDGQWDRAYEIADAEVRSSIGFMQGLAYSMRAGPQIYQGRLREAAEDLELAAARMGNTETQAFGAFFHTRRALIFQAAREYRTAEMAVRDAIRIDPYYGPGYF